MATEYYFKNVINPPISRDVILKAIDILATPVKRTLGPEGLPILLQREANNPLSTKDGVTVSNSIYVEDQAVDTVIQSIKESARKTNEEAGDGTTTAIVLTEAFVKEGFKLIGMDMIKPQELVARLKDYYTLIVEELENIKKPIVNEQQQKDVALISANNDYEVADKVVEAIGRAGEDGFVIIDDGGTSGIEVVHLEGYRLDSGFDKFGAPGTMFITHPEKQIAKLFTPHVVFYNGELSDINDFATFLMDYTENGANWPSAIAIVAHDFSGAFLSFVMANRDKGAPLYLIKTPFLGSRISSRSVLLKDISVYCGCSDVVQQKEKAFTVMLSDPDYRQKYIGKCDKITIERYQATVYSDLGSTEDGLAVFTSYIETLKGQINDCDSVYDADFIRTRISKMLGGVVHINVGGKTELEFKEKKARVEDAYHATTAAIEQGILPGGGCALFYVSTSLDDKDFVQKYLKDVLQYPIRQILSNAGLKVDVIMDKIESKFKDNNPYFGFNVQTKEYCNDLLQAGVIDPLKVTKSALANAFSIATQLLINGGVISHDKFMNKRDVANV